MDCDTTERYDRQIRLWGQHGQNRCSSAKVCLINANSLGTEILKGLCLAGIGSFTILDSNNVTPDDIGCNLLPHDSLGMNRAEAVKLSLLDLNPEVVGDFYPLESHLPIVTVTQNADDNEIHDRNLKFWKQFNCVIASGFLNLNQIITLSKLCWDINCPLLLCKSIGFYGSLNSQIREHLIIETHPDNQLPDFNLDSPFTDLEQYFDSIDLNNHSNLDNINSYPYVVIVYKFLKQWQDKNDFEASRLPVNYAEKKELKAMIDNGLKEVLMAKKKARNTQLPNAYDQEVPFENFLDAAKAVNYCLTPATSLPESVNYIFNHPNVVEPPTQFTSKFWLIVKAVREFVYNKNYGRLPVSGNIPDMTASSQEYLRIQSIYSKKAREDVDNVMVVVQNLINSTNRSFASSLYDETKLICKNIRDLRIIQNKPIHEEYELKNCSLRDESEEDEFITIDICLRAVDIFFTTYGRLPGCQDEQVETDISKLKDSIKQIMGKCASRMKTLDQCLYELCRYGGCELHATSAFLGGCIAQEVIKLITNQYVPVDGSLIYNATQATVRIHNLTDALAMSA